MSVTRRGILAAVALAQSNLLGGCFGGTDGTQADTSSGGGGSDATASPTPEPTTAEPTATETPTETPTATPVANAEVAARTGEIIAEFEWFRTEYDAAISRFQISVNDVFGALKQLEDAAELAESDVATLRTATTTVAEYVQANLVPHFEVDPALRVGDNVFVRDLERAIARGDTQLQDSVLSRARVFYQRAISRGYLDNEMSRRPVYDTLYDMLIPDGSPDRIVALISADDDFVTWAHPDRTESTADDGIDQHTHEFPSGYRVYTHAHAHSSGHATNDHSNEPRLNELYAYGDGGVALLEDQASWRERLDDYEPVYTDLFGPVKTESRAAGVTMFVDTIDAAFSASPLYVEGFESVDAARAAVSSDGSPVGSEGTMSFAGRRWERIFYDAAGTTIYAYRLRAGSNVVVALPSDVPWERRSEWSAGLGPTWLGAASN